MRIKMYNNLNEIEYEFGILVFSATFNYIMATSFSGEEAEVSGED